MRIFAALLITVSLPAMGQQKTYTGFPSVVWPKLYAIAYVKSQDRYGDYEKPVFTETVKQLDNQTIVLPGYMVPFENGNTGNRFMLTSLPLNACYFCGVGGPETVVEVFLKNVISYTDKPVEVRGILKLNDTDPDQMIYRLEQAEFLGVIDF